MLKTMLKVQLSAVWNSLFSRGNKSTKKRGIVMKILIGLLAAYVIGALLFTISLMFGSLAAMLVEAGLSKLYWVLVFTMVTVTCFITTVFLTGSTMFEAKDNEMLLAMPIKPGVVLISRLASLYILDLIFSLFFFIPTTIFYLPSAPISAFGFVSIILGALAAPLASLALCCVCGWIVSVIPGGNRIKSIIYVGLTVAFMIVYFSVVFNIQNVAQTLITDGGRILSTLSSWFLPSKFFAEAVSGNPLSLLIFLLCCTVPFALVFYFMKKSFYFIMTHKTAAVKKVYVEKHSSEHSAFSALYAKEFSRLFKLPVYLLNSCLGVALIVAAGVAVCVKSDALTNIVPSLPGNLSSVSLLLCAVFGFCAVMTDTACSSISLEGNNFWILQTSPIRTRDVLLAKLALAPSITIPAIIVSALIANISVSLPTTELLLLILLPSLLVIFTNIFGLLANLIFPRFDWLNPTYVVKQSLSSMIGILVPLFLFMAMFGVLVSKATSAVSLLVMMCLIIAALSVVFAVVLFTVGKKLYESIAC